jgi:DMSO reductase family type II enzyme heme b subunit
MFPRPRDFVRAEYKIRSTHHGRLPTDDDLFQVISRGMPGTPMPGWEKILTVDERRNLVEYVKSLSPRFGNEDPDPIAMPSGPGSAERGEEAYREAKCYLCHGEAGRGDGPIATTLNFEWGLPHAARDFTRGWTFRGGHDPRDIYLRITGGLEGTPMGPYRDLLTDQERWDLAHYIASLDREPTETNDEFVVVAALIDGKIPETPDSPEWGEAASIVVPLAGQVVLEAGAGGSAPGSNRGSLGWWVPTVESMTVRSLWNGAEVGFLLEWNDPTGPADAAPDSVFLQFPANEDSKPYFLLGDGDNPVKIWHWQTDGPPPGVGGRAEAWTASGGGRVDVGEAHFRADPFWEEGRWRVIFRGSLDGGPEFKLGKFMPALFSVRDGANGEIDDVRAISTWLYVTLERPKSGRPWLAALAYVLGAVIVELWVLSRMR